MDGFRLWQRRGGEAIAAAFLFIVAPNLASAADDPTPDLTAPDLTTPGPVAPKREGVAATVNGKAISVDSVDAAVRNVVQGRKIDEASLKRLRAEALAQLIDQSLLLEMLTKGAYLATDAEVEQAIGKYKKQAEDQKVDFAKTLADRKVSEDQLRAQIRWQLSANRYVQRALTDAVLKSFFEANKREFDGTELRVSHILLRPDSTVTQAETERLTKMAAKLRERIASKTIGFETAAERYSAGPSRHKGGDIGYVPRSGLMAEPFAAAAFRLKEGQLSEPVVSPYGVHLIKITGVKPGTKDWEEVKEQLKPLAAQQLIARVTEAERKKADIQFTGACPHFKPGTRELAED